MKRISLLFVLLIAVWTPARGSESDALNISHHIQQRHLPHGLILDPIFSSPTSDAIVGYAHGGDAAIWTGHYLAAEAFRYRVTGSAEALANVQRALAGLRLLVDVTGDNLLARCAFPVDWEFAQSVLDEEKRHGIHLANGRRAMNGREYYWLGNTSRDQYSGVFFGLAVAYDFVDDQEVKRTARDLITRLLDYLLAHNWFVVMPNGETSTTFTGHPDQRLSFLAVGRRVNASRFSAPYSWARFFSAATVGSAILVDLADNHTSYFKFNLDTINLYNLIRLEGNSSYRDRYLNIYRVLRRTTDDHGNAHFNLLDRALTGPNAPRDAETRELLAQWLQRPRRDEWLDWRGHYATCDTDKACAPLSVVDRIRTDFLWQRSPFLLFGGGYGTIEGAGIDYILPYWMARHFGVIRE